MRRRFHTGWLSCTAQSTHNSGSDRPSEGNSRRCTHRTLTSSRTASHRWPQSRPCRCTAPWDFRSRQPAARSNRSLPQCDRSHCTPFPACTGTADSSRCPAQDRLPRPSGRVRPCNIQSPWDSRCWSCTWSRNSCCRRDLCSRPRSHRSTAQHTPSVRSRRWSLRCSNPSHYCCQRSCRCCRQTSPRTSFHCWTMTRRRSPVHPRFQMRNRKPPPSPRTPPTQAVLLSTDTSHSLLDTEERRPQQRRDSRRGSPAGGNARDPASRAGGRAEAAHQPRGRPVRARSQLFLATAGRERLGLAGRCTAPCGGPGRRSVGVALPASSDQVGRQAQGSGRRCRATPVAYGSGIHVGHAPEAKACGCDTRLAVSALSRLRLPFGWSRAERPITDCCTEVMPAYWCPPSKRRPR